MKKLVLLLSVFSFSQSFSQSGKKGSLLGNTMYAPVLNIGVGGAIRNTFKQDNAFGLGAGIDVYKPVYKGFWINPKLMVQAHNYKRNDDALFKVTYLHLSTPLVLMLPSEAIGGTKGSAIIVGIGPYVGASLSGKWKPDGGSYSKMKFGNTSTDNRQAIDAGLTWKINFVLSKLMFGIERSSGKKNLWPAAGTSGNSFYTRSTSFIMGINLGRDYMSN